MTRTRYRFLGTDAPYFLTMTINNWLPVFTRPETVEAVLNSWRYLQANHGFRLHGYVMRQKLDYIHCNPVKRGYVDLPEHWRWSSARDYLGQPGLIDVDTGWLGS
jgi:putative transposase